MATGLRILLTVVWAAFMVVMANWPATDHAVIGAAVGTLVLGWVVGRWWVLLVPVVLGVILASATLLSDPDDFYEGSPRLWAAYIAFVVICIAALLGLGIAAHRGIAHARRERQPRSRPAARSR